MMPPDLTNSPQKKRVLSNSKKAVKNESTSIKTTPDDKNGVLPKAKAINKTDKINTSITKKIDIKIKEEIMESNNEVKNTTKNYLIKKQQNIQQKESLIQETTNNNTKSITKKRKLIKDEINSSINQSPNINNNIANNEFNPLDNILNEIDAYDTSNKPKNKKKREKMPKIESPSDDVNSGNAPCSSQQFPSTPFPSAATITTRPLNKLELARQEHDNSMVQLFLHKDDLMERILAYKMLRGRVESFLTMKAKIDLNNCITPEYEIRPDLVEPVSERLHPKLEALIKQVQTDEAINEEQQQPLPPPFPPPPLFDSSSSFVPPPPPSLIPSEEALSQALHGPMTPPGSPGTNQSSLTANNGIEQHQQHKHQQEMFPCTSDTLMTNEELIFQQPRQPLKIDKSDSTCTNEELFKKFGSMLGLPEQQILTFFGVDLKKYADLQFDELLATFRESLAKHLSEKEKKKHETSSKSPAESVDYLEQFQSSQCKSLEQQNLMNVSDELEAAMEISSTSSSSIFLPPPPAPPPMLCNNSNSMHSTSREAVEDDTKSPIDSSISSQQQKLTSLFSQGQQLVFTRPPPPIPSTLITRSSAPQLLSQNQPQPQLFLQHHPHMKAIETVTKIQNLISDSSIVPQQQQKRPPSLLSQIPFVFTTPPPAAIRFMNHLLPRPPLMQQNQQFLHPPPRPPLSSKDMNETDSKSSNLISEPSIMPQQKQSPKKIPSLFSKRQPLVFPRPPPPIPLAATPRMTHPLPLNHHPSPQQQQFHHPSTSEIETKSQTLIQESSSQQQRGLTPPFPQVSLVFTTPPPPVPTSVVLTAPPVAPQITPIHQQLPPTSQQQQQFLQPPPPMMPSQNDILKTVVQAINVGKPKEINNNKVKSCVGSEKDDSATNNSSSPYGKFF